MSDFSDLLKSLQAKIADNSAVQALVSEFDGQPAVFVGTVPVGAVLPYVLVFLIVDVPFDTHDRKGERALYQVSVFARGSYEAKDILSAANDALHFEKTSPGSYSCLNVKRTAGPRCVFEPKEEVSHVSADYEVLAQILG